MKKLMAMVISMLLVCCMAVLPAAAQTAEISAQEVITADGLRQLLADCTGYAGTAGSSLKGAIRAEKVLDYCLKNQLAQTDREAFAQLLSDAHAALTVEQQEELVGNMEGIFAVLDAGFGEYLSVEGLLNSAGVKETMDSLLKEENARRHYGVFKLAMLNVFGDFDKLLLSCTGYAGTAGSSMKNAIAAKSVLEFCTKNHVADADSTMLAEMIAAAHAKLDEERAQELAWNMESIAGLLDKAFADYESVEDLLDSAGIAQDMLMLLGQDGAYADWAVFYLQISRVIE